MTQNQEVESGVSLLSTVGQKIGNYRWTIVALLFVATTVNYVDRQVIAVLKPVLQEELGWSEIDYGNIVFYFQMAYAAGYAGAGRLMDKIGVRWGLPLAIGLWSVAACAHGAVRTVAGFSLARGVLGIAEGGNFPASIKTVGEWFPKKERALATGLFNSGSNIGALIAPLLVPWLAVSYGWQFAFYFTGALGFFWIVAWVLLYGSPRDHPRLSEAERAHILQDGEEEKPKPISWLKLLTFRPVWAFVAAMFLVSPVWWFYLFWVPDFLHKSHGLDLLHLGPPLVAIYLITDLGSIGGGWLSSFLIGRGMSVLSARKVAFLVCALCVVPIFFAARVSDLWVATGIIALAASAHQGFAANLYTIVSDTMPGNAVSSVVGLGGLAGSIGGMFVAKFAGYILQTTGSYILLFSLASGAYLLATLIIHLLVPSGYGRAEV